MAKPDSRYASEVQMGPQELLRELLEASANYDRIEGCGAETLGKASLVQQASANKAAITRCIEILKAANADDECAEALCLVVSVLATVERARLLQRGTTQRVWLRSVKHCEHLADGSPPSADDIARVRINSWVTHHRLNSQAIFPCHHTR